MKVGQTFLPINWMYACNEYYILPLRRCQNVMMSLREWKIYMCELSSKLITQTDFKSLVIGVGGLWTS